MAGLAAAVQDALSTYEIPDDDLIGDVLMPAMSHAEEVRIGTGFFSSRSLAEIAPGLVGFITASQEPLRLLLSPVISNDDREAIRRAVTTPEEVVAEVAGRILDHARLRESAVVAHTLDCLAYLIACDRLELRFVLMPEGMYHKKKWLFRDGEHWLGVHGSGNLTQPGLISNGEQMTVDKAWADGPVASDRVDRLIRQWDRQWNNDHPGSLTVSDVQGLRFAGPHPPSSVPTMADFWDAWRADSVAGLEPQLPPNVLRPPAPRLVIPPDLEWRSGTYAHQGRAVDAFFDAGGRGVFEIATGGGKTRTALICATIMQDRHDGPFLVVVLVPSKPLMNQWAEDVRGFGIQPVVLSRFGPAERRAKLQEIVAAMSGSVPRTEVLIASNALFARDEAVRSLLDRLGDRALTFLVGDEMHNLGTPSFIEEPPEQFERRLGLSATPVRQYDPDGTDRLFDFFGPPIFSFGLADAIKANCLVPYRYHLHEVTLTEEEADKYLDLTTRLRTAGFHIDDDGRMANTNDAVDHLLRQRRAVLEQADGKVAALADLLRSTGPANIRRALIYTSAKGSVVETVRQIEKVNALVAGMGIISHQFTNAETSRSDAEDLLAGFGRGDYQVLTAMKVLDEGIDIPQTDTAFLLASTTVRREWVQRRGRILRRAPGKQTASVHDFLVVPPDIESGVARSQLKGELARAEEFSSLAENEWDPDGPRRLISKYDEAVWSGGQYR